YNYQTKTGGPTLTKKISDSEVRRQGEIAAQKVLQRVRKKSGVGNVPIVIALYKQAPDDSLVGGTFFAYSKNSGNTLSSWRKLHYKLVLVPKASAATTNSSGHPDDDSFSNVESQLQSFCPILS